MKCFYYYSSFAPGAGRGGILNRLCENSGNGGKIELV